jgi:hypothetical protein
MADTAVKNQIKFLNIHYPGISILVNECQLTSGIKIGSEKSMSSPCSYINSSMEYNSREIVVFDLDKYLMKYFNSVSKSDIRVALIIELDLLHKNTSSLVKKNLEGFERLHRPYHFLALKVKCMLESIKIGIDNINLLPDMVREKCSTNGLIGISFPGESGIDYIIDLNTVILEGILKDESGMDGK